MQDPEMLWWHESGGGWFPARPAPWGGMSAAPTCADGDPPQRGRRARLPGVPRLRNLVTQSHRVGAGKSAEEALSLPSSSAVDRNPICLLLWAPSISLGFFVLFSMEK